MKKWFLAVVLVLAVSGVCSAQSIEYEFLKIRKVISEKMVKIDDNAFIRMFKYLIRPDTKLSYWKTESKDSVMQAHYFIGTYQELQDNGDYASLEGVILYVPEITKKM